VCARAAKGVVCAGSDGSSFGASFDGPQLSNDAGYTDAKYYSTLRMGDLNGDGRADLCARSSAGISCWLGDEGGFGSALSGPEWSDAKGWGERRFYTTLQLADIDGDGQQDLCARAGKGIVCHRFEDGSFGAAIEGPALADDAGWGSDRYYGTIRFGDINGDGKDDVCARAAAGFRCYLSDGQGFPTTVTGPELSDAKGWGAAKYWATLRLADIDGDGKDDLCGRAAAGIRCWPSAGDAFGEAIVGPELSDAQGWGAGQYWSTIRMADLDGDGKADLCARAIAGMRCWLSDGAGFAEQWVGPELSDAKGWNKPEHFSSLRLADVSGDGRADLCARAAAGVLCWSAQEGGFGEAVTGPGWANDSGWDKPMYALTLQAAGSCVASEESCNGVDDDCDGQVDEGACGVSGSGGQAGGSDAGSGSSAGASADPEDGSVDGSGCGCRSAAPTQIALWPAGVLGLLLLRRRRRYFA
jgi:MYXO-CTERM domain-containing protein